MSKSTARKIMVNNAEFIWTQKNNTINGAKEVHIKVYSAKVTKSVLYIDPYDWYFEVRPKTISEAILYALKQGWNPEIKHTGMIISMKEGEFYVLPEGVKFRYELK
ncbi:MAG: hypothetical protein AAF597_08505 [Bacteroidota bacterium]